MLDSLYPVGAIITLSEGQEPLYGGDWECIGAPHPDGMVHGSNRLMMWRRVA